ncbi:MAG TPA: hypothetical protein VGF67_03900 [Ktedonobacteraceae bacterium]|jgi:hypothetical protein
MQDLWADFAGELHSHGDAGHGMGLHQRRPTEQTVLAELRAWLLQEYMLPYGMSLGATRIFKRCYWIDGLGNLRISALSPQLSVQVEETVSAKKRDRRKPPASTLPPALQMAEVVAYHLEKLERPIMLHSLALEEQRGQHNKRSRQTSQNGATTDTPLVLPKADGILPGSWPELAPVLLPALEGCAAVFLLNPLKRSLFRHTDLVPLFGRAAPTELLLWLPHKQIETRLLPILSTSEGAASLTNLLRGDRWKALLAKSGASPQLIIPELVKLLVQSMRQHFLAVQLLTFPVRTGPALVETVPYSLIFATRRQDSLASMNDAVCHRGRRLVAESHQGVLNEQWFIARCEEQETARLATLTQEVLTLGRAQRARRWPDLRQQLLLNHFGQHALHDYDTAIARLLAQGEARCEWRKRAQETAELPGNDDLLLWK